MGDEIDPRRLITEEVFKDIVAVLQTVYGGGQINQNLTWDQKRELRAKSYRTLKVLGLQK